MNGKMDKDEYDFIKSDWSTYNDERTYDTCSYCGEESDNLNIVYYAINDVYDIVQLAVNPKPHDIMKVPSGYWKKHELVCDECMKDED
jgi:hypothetical protein